ncbi:MAG: hypothetical protein JW860_16165 [Sedimentisphaerales bacterium]|nr:hypothetical protein [Sedimentisphaerales bacterium]
MEFLRRIIKQIQAQLKGLRFTDKLAVGLLLIIICGAVLWMVNYSSRQEEVPLLDQAFAEDARGRIIQRLESWNEKYRVEGDRIIVPVSRRADLVALLSYEELMPEDTSVGWQSILQDTNVWTPESVRDKKDKIVLQVELARTIAKFPGVRKADVFINTGGKRTLSNHLPAASASVAVQTSGAVSNKRKLASSIAATVSAANNRMKRENITVTIDGELVPVAPKGQELSSDYIERLVVWEERYRKKILDALPPGINARIQVDAKLHNTRVRTQSHKIADEGEGTLVATIDQTSRETNSNNVQRNEEPGLVANASESARSNSGNTQTDTTEDSTKKNTVLEGWTDTVEETPEGGISKKDLTAVVSIPNLYFESIAKQLAGNDAQPDQAAVETVMEMEIPKLKQIVMRAIGLADSQYENNVVVESYWADGTSSDLPGLPGMGGPGGEGTPEAFSIQGVTRQYGKHIGVSALALLSMVFVLRMVRKASVQTDYTEEESTMMMGGQRPLDALSVDDTNIVDGQEASGLLAGVELDDEAVRSQQVLQQIRDMVQEAPEVAANLIDKWMKQDA